MAKDYPAYSELTPKQRKLALAKWHERQDAKDPAKQRKARLDEEIAPGLTRRDLRQDTRAAAVLKYGEPSQQLRRQPGRINDWFDQYKQAITQSRNQAVGSNPDEIGGYYGAAVQGVQNLQQGLNTAAQQQWAGQQAQMASDAAQRGATTDSVLAEQARNAAGVRGMLTAGVGATLLGQGANEAAYLGRRRANAEVGRIGALRENASARADLAKERGAFKADYRRQARSDAIKNYLNQVAAESLIDDRVADNKRQRDALKISDANQDATRERTNSRWLDSLNKYGYTNRQWRNMTPAQQAAIRKRAEKDKGKDDKDDKWGTQSQQNSAKDSIDYAVSAAKRLKAAGYTRSEAAQVLLSGRSPQTVDGQKIPGYNKTPKDYASVGLDVAFDGHISKRNITVLRQRGIKVKPLGYPMTAPKTEAIPGVGVTTEAGVG